MIQGEILLELILWSDSPFKEKTLSEFVHCEVRTKNSSQIIIIIIKKDWQCKAGTGRLTSYQSKDPSPTLPTYRGKEEKGKIVENQKGESN